MAHVTLQSNLRLAEGLRECLLLSLADPSNQVSLNRVIRVCHTLAAKFLSSKRNTGILMNIHGLNLCDLAFDCIAELFQRDDDGRLVQLSAYFSSLSLDDVDDQEMLAHLRRLVFSKVNHEVFRLFNASDPALARIRRNIKIAVQTLQHFVEVEKFGDTYLAPAMCDMLEHLPIPDRDEIHAELMTDCSPSRNIPDMLATLSRSLRAQTSHARLVPLLSVALIIREVYSGNHNPSESVPRPDEYMVLSDAADIIRDCVKATRERMHHRYIVEKNLPIEVFDSYFHIIEDGLQKIFVDLDGSDFGLLEGLSRIFPGLTEEEYRTKHRSRLEYFARITKAAVMHRLRKEMGQ